MAGTLNPLEVASLDLDLGRRRILDQVAFAAPAAGWFGLLGVNGSGKTTLLRAIAGRLQPRSGSIRIAGQDLAADPAARAHRVGFSPPPDSLPEELTGRELIDLVAAARRASPNEPPALAEALEVRALDRRLIGQMSSGMRQRLALYTAFIGQPDLVLLDEPFNWLDPVAAYELKAALRIWTAAGGCLVTALHDVAAFALRCDGGVLMHEGRVLRRFNPEEMAAGRTDLAAFEEAIYRIFRAEHAAA
jgi:ABC-type multidrug transport system ATPase subunit